MSREFAIRKDVAFAAAPDRVWRAVATGPGLASWFMPHEIEPRVGGVARLAFAGYTDESTVTAWEPPDASGGVDPVHGRFAARGAGAAEGTFEAIEYDISSGDGGGTRLRFTFNGVAGDDWDAGTEDRFGAGWNMYLHTLGQYLAHFDGRTAAYVVAQGPQADRPWALLVHGLGLGESVAEGDRVSVAPRGLPPVDGVVDYRRRGFLGLHGEDALYRFHLRPDAIAVGHHLFRDDADPKESERAWQAWLDTVSDDLP